MLAVGLRELKALDVGGIAAEVVAEQIGVEFEIPGVHTETEFPVEPAQRVSAPLLPAGECGGPVPA